MGLSDPLVISFGGGVNSAAMILGMHERGLRPDLILFADTGAEKPETYDFLGLMGQFTAREMGLDVITVRASTKTDESLEKSCLRLEHLPSIVYGSRTCSQRWKLQPCEKYENHWPLAQAAWAAGSLVRKAVGIDAGELRRAKEFIDKKYRVVYPLIEWGWSREECVACIKRMGLPVPVKSACFYCPSSKKSEVIHLKNKHPDLFDRAVKMEQAAASKLLNIKGLGRHWSWESLGLADEAQFKMFPESVEAPCGCFDGEE